MWTKQLVGDLGEKKRWREAQARITALPVAYRDAARAVQQYLLHLGAVDDDRWTAAVDDLVDLFERASADRTPIRDLVGEDPVEFAEDFSRNYGSGGWRTRARRDLVDAIDRAEAAAPEA